jgi:hypothetical protein
MPINEIIEQIVNVRLDGINYYALLIVGVAAGNPSREGESAEQYGQRIKTLARSIIEQMAKGHVEESR